MNVDSFQSGDRRDPNHIRSGLRSSTKAPQSDQQGKKRKRDDQDITAAKRQQVTMGRVKRDKKTESETGLPQLADELMAIMKKKGDERFNRNKRPPPTDEELREICTRRWLKKAKLEPPTTLPAAEFCVGETDETEILRGTIGPAPWDGAPVRGEAAIGRKVRILLQKTAHSSAGRLGLIFALLAHARC